MRFHAWTGRVASAAVDFAARQLTLIFEDAAAASGGPTASALRVERARASAARGFALLDPLDDTAFEHGAYRAPPAADGPTTRVVPYDKA